jgi:hypothetical protein
MNSTEFKAELLKVASSLRDISTSLATEEKQAEQEQESRTKTASERDFSFGDVGGAKRSSDPLMDFIFS